LINGDRDSLGGWVRLVTTVYGYGLITHLNTSQVTRVGRTVQPKLAWKSDPCHWL